ncbi:MAG TPA: NAD(P)H-hydrate dehydratase [Acidimicrobiia bacterium]|nr:NAD(P)H-hydrate dehydratase [Acidimicrobiia bacterium]
MLPVITPAEAARLDQASAVGIDVLMERAGRAVAQAAVGMGATYGKRVVVLAGPGNNGGDGYVAARHLRERGVGVRVRALSGPKTDAAVLARDRAAATGVIIEDLIDAEAFDVVIDALFGGGFRPGTDPAVEAWIHSGQRVLAVDIPSGVDPLTGKVVDGAFRAERTVTFGAHKVGHLLNQGPDYSGSVEVADIGLPRPDPAMYLTERSDVPIPRRNRTTHKWSAGSVLVVGGAVGMTGAAVMAGRAALHFGAGAVGLAVPEAAAQVAAATAPELLHHHLDEIPERYQVLVIGPGLGRDHDDLATKLIATWRGPVVVDADALSLVTGAKSVPGASDGETGREVVFTPHAGEFERMGGGEPSSENASALALRLGAIVLLKGNPTIVAGSGTPSIINSGGPELATIGTGDVLAGMLGALLGQGLEPAVAARTAAFWHGTAGARLGRRTTVTAWGLIEEIGSIR